MKFEEKEFITYGHIFDPEKFQEPSNGRRFTMNKPDGGFWASPTESINSWKDWCLSEDFWGPDKFEVYTKFRFKKSSRIYTIDCVRDLENLIRSHGKLSPLFGRCFIDWEKVSKDYDGVYLTAAGSNRCHLSYPHDLNSWDVESVVVLKQDSIEILEKKNGPA